MSFLGSVVGGLSPAGIFGSIAGSGATGSNPLSNLGSSSGGIDWASLINSQNATAAQGQAQNQSNITSLQNRLAGISAPTTVSPQSVTASAVNAPTSLPQYDLARASQSQSNAADTSTANDALSRKFAALGGGPTGAAIKAQTNQSTQLENSNDQAMAGINEQEAGQLSQMQQQDSLVNAQNEQQAGEFNASNSQQAQQFNTQMGQTYQQFGFSANSQIAQLDSSMNQQAQDAATTAFNENLQQYQAEHSGGLLGAGGLLGTGIGT